MSAPRGAAALRPALLYSQCWEDASIARAALRIQPGATVLAVAAAGDNVLALLADDPGRILAIDVNPAQTALLELKIAALRSLPGPGRAGAFLGAAPSDDRVGTYRGQVRDALPDNARAWWDEHLDQVARGVIHAGRFERYLALFRRLVLPVAPGRATVRAMLEAADVADQRRIYRARWDSRRWRLLFRVFFSRGLLRRLGRDPAFFEHCEIGDIGAHYLARAEHALLDIPIRSNPYLTYILSGGYGPGDRMPDYLRPEVAAALCGRLDRIVVRTASLDDVLRTLPAQSVDAFYLSDVFELVGPAEHAATLREVLRVGRPGARICYWNNLVDRRRPDALAGSLLSDGRESDQLHARDRAFLYSRIVVESVGGAAR
jgi:S-adenosylmethionine-diacylglycerol 3-amino-3-carboxypropyl transferase